MSRSIARARRCARPRLGQPGRATPIWALFLVLLLSAAPAGAAPNDAQAARLADAAMNDFDAEQFKKAVAGLERALKLCKRGCDKAVRARLHRDLGVVYITGLRDRKRGKEQFSKALALDPRIELDSARLTSEVAGAFQRARWDGDTQSKKKPRASARIEHKTPRAAQHDTPLPIYLRLSPKADAKTVRLIFTWGSRPWMVLRMKRMQGGYGAQIPCADIRAGETLEYYVEARDADGQELAKLGSKQTPLQVDVERRLRGKPPSFPGKRPPKRCADAEAEAETETDAEAEGCERDEDCAPGRCEEGSCVAKADRPKSFFVGLHLIQDAALVSGTDVCTQSSQRDAGFSCFRSDGSQYLGTPQPGMRNVIAGELTLATTRIALGADLKLADQFSIGLRVGYAILGGAPDVTGGKPFFPLHAEARAAHWLSSAYATSVAPFLFVAGGVARVDAKNTVTVVEDRSVPPPPYQPDNPDSQDLDAYKKMGLMFAGAGMGAYFPFGSANGLTAELRFLFLFPDTGFVLGPALGYSLGL